MKEVVPLAEGWSLRHSDDLLPAQVPGCVHTDLLTAGLIPDPFLGVNESDVAWVGQRAWTYVRDLPATCTDTATAAPEHERTDLVFDGLDTAATITLDGRELGRTRNMHRRHRFDVTGRHGLLEVDFASAYDEAASVRALTGERPNVYPEPFQYIRKMACGFGWDWGPTLVTAGIWRPVRLERWSTARLAGVRPLVTVHGGTGRVELRVEVERTAQGTTRPLAVRATVGNGLAEARGAVEGTHAVLTLQVPDADLWWPRGYGDQPLYDLELALVEEAAGPGGEERSLDTWHRRIGFRTVEVDRSADSHGTGFTLVVNGERVFARGVNWIPDDVFPSRITPERYRTRLRQTADAGVDLVRIWGGGIYEDDAFYDACDELGLMVWQDFLFACAAYPEEQPLRGEVEAEARDNVVRLMPHPSLVLWNGNNENLWGFRDWDWEPELRGDSWGGGYYLDLLPRIVAELDPTRPYTAGSPWSGSWDHHPNDPAHGTYHSWEVWNRRDYAEYRDSVPRFVSEFGWQAPPAMATLRRALPGERLAPDSPGMLHHQKAEDGNGKLNRGVERHFALPEGDFDRWHYLTQVVQARAIATGIEHWRSHWPVCAGTVVWQINDCWPVSSWSAIDGDGRLKPLYHELRRVYADRLLTVQPGDGHGGPPVLAVVNQSAEPWQARVTLRRLRADGTEAAGRAIDVTVPARSVHRRTVPQELAPAPRSAKEFLVADSEDLRSVHFCVTDRDFAYPVPHYDVAVESPVGSGTGNVEVVVTAHTLVRDLLLQADRLGPDAVCDTGLRTLLPGERLRLRVTGAAETGANAVRAALFCVEPA
ncbi:glycoside hydrolase family 2 protein [Streptomyces anthocyanicus]|uniref:Glycoside hydrolase family 2 protein n=1 Tax=Streptomyces violaceoruber TaxID=1935 RepID=A0ACD4WH58_STRVN|nr:MULTISPECIES: glycoside hydrolase family 2 protein [unclassified Streptomyces]WOY97231.1 glycoside hydrolase family 2 protein [Streptomyces violaceoruber]WTC12052.1 glycoside hydrolase family 2 protein [Streptomyces anthocyanicus]BDD75770.1 beta-mannosidase [Streptomyces coelicolor]MDX3367360.1 glycoside hydrolase family 2 protein [Streptomyces sp. ME02-6987-2C]MDX3423353.1 glycoside hydrolase family 2 protein [Streptomyces sp. ME02-6985-2c]